MESDTWNKETLVKAIRVELERFLIASFFRGYPTNPLSEHELNKKTEHQLNELYCQFKKNNWSYLYQFKKEQEDDSTRFFNQPECNADYSYWAKHAYWHFDQAVALLLDKDPRKVSYETLKHLFEISPFAKKYQEIFSLIQGYHLYGKLSEIIEPMDVLNWADDIDIDIPIKLKEAVNGLKSQKKNNLKKFDKECLQGAERKTMLKIILGMAIHQYGYNPLAGSKNKATGTKGKSISAGLDTVGLKVNDDTIRKYLKEATETFPDV